jgi:hypothetical protein
MHACPRTPDGYLFVPVSARDSAGQGCYSKPERQVRHRFNAGDIASVAALYTEDAVVLPPGADMVEGRSAIQAFWKTPSSLVMQS